MPVRYKSQVRRVFFVTATQSPSEPTRHEIATSHSILRKRFLWGSYGPELLTWRCDLGIMVLSSSDVSMMYIGSLFAHKFVWTVGTFPWQILLICYHSCEPKICNLVDMMTSHKNVSCCQISVDKISAFQVHHAICNLQNQNLHNILARWST